jgi:hypothetical protein
LFFISKLLLLYMAVILVNSPYGLGLKIAVVIGGVPTVNN